MRDLTEPDGYPSTVAFSGSPIHRLVLWDIDGTLIASGTSAPCFDEAIEEVTGRRPIGGMQMGGLTDLRIIREKLAALGIEPTADLIDVTHRRIAALLEASVSSNRRALPGVLPGAADVLKGISSDKRAVSTLLTGNTRPNAEIKLSAHKLASWLDLEIGAYGSDDEDRNALVPIAVRRFEEKFQWQINSEDVWVVGDTPRDLECAAAGGARCLLVATGDHPLEELQALDADQVLPDLAGVSAVLSTLLGDL